MTVGHIGPADGDDQQHAEHQRQAGEDGEDPRLGRVDDEPHSERCRDPKQREVGEVLTAVGDGALGQHLLQLAHGHQAAVNVRNPSSVFEHERDHHERGQSLVDLVGPVEFGCATSAAASAPQAWDMAVRCGHRGHGMM